MSKCIVAECERDAANRKRGLCVIHYGQMRDGIKFTCTVENCKRPLLSGGLCQMHYARKFRHGTTDSLLPNYGSHRVIHKQGYIRIWNGYKYEMEHVLMAEKALGKKLPAGAIVHHMNENPWDNKTPFNLVVCQNQEYHMLLHRRARRLREKEQLEKNDE